MIALIHRRGTAMKVDVLIYSSICSFEQLHNKHKISEAPLHAIMCLSATNYTRPNAVISSNVTH